MRIVLAPDSFKESMSAAQAVAAMRRGVLAVFPDAECLEYPLADGGEGTSAVLSAALGATPHTARVRDAHGEPVDASFAMTDDSTAIVDVASAVGLALTPPARRQPMGAASWGVGDLIGAGLDLGMKRLIVGLGGSSTNDGGAGLMVALGARLVDADGCPCDPTPSGLLSLGRVDLSGLDSRLASVRIDVACDVDNPLLGVSGASAVFGPQKGATATDVPLLEQALERWADALTKAVGRDESQTPGAGAAGGMGFAFLMLGARARRGIDVVIGATGLEQHIADADLVLTGEGSFDAQTSAGKAPWGVAQAARRHGVPVIGFAGRVGDVPGGVLDAVFPIVPGPVGLDEALRDGEANLTSSVERAMCLIKLQIGRQRS